MFIVIHMYSNNLCVNNLSCRQPLLGPGLIKQLPQLSYISYEKARVVACAVAKVPGMVCSGPGIISTIKRVSESLWVFICLPLFLIFSLVDLPFF